MNSKGQLRPKSAVPYSLPVKNGKKKHEMHLDSPSPNQDLNPGPPDAVHCTRESHANADGRRQGK